MENIDVVALLEKEFYSDHFLGKCHRLKKTTRYFTNKKMQTRKNELEIIA